MAPGSYGDGGKIFGESRRIIESQPGRGTGDVEYHTADGSVWVPASYYWMKPPITGQVFGVAVNGQVKQTDP